MITFLSFNLYFFIEVVKGSPHDGARGRWLGHSRALPSATRSMPGEGSEPGLSNQQVILTIILAHPS
jgi:hypothetical protein